MGNYHKINLLILFIFASRYAIIYTIIYNINIEKTSTIHGGFMDKKRSSKIVHILFFIAALYFSIYILLNYDKTDMVSIVGSGVILLIASYFLFDKLQYEAERKKEIDEQKRNEENNEKLLALSEITKVQKASYMVLKRGSRILEEQMHLQLEEIKNLSENIGQAREDMSKAALQTKRLVTVVESIQKNNAALIEIEKSGYQALIKYNKENTRQIVLNNNENINNIIKDITASLRSFSGQLTNTVNTDFTDILDKYANLSSVMIENTITVSDRIEDISGTLKEYKNIIEDTRDQIDSREYKRLASETAVRIPKSKIEEEPKVKTVVETDINAKNDVESIDITDELLNPLYNYELEQETIDSLIMDAEDNDELDLQSLFELPISNEEDTWDYQKDSSIESPVENIVDNYIDNNYKPSQSTNIIDTNPIQDAKQEEEQEESHVEAHAKDSSLGYVDTSSDKPDFATHEVPGVDLSDPNKKMSPDDIAALIAAMTS